MADGRELRRWHSRSLDETHGDRLVDRQLQEGRRWGKRRGPHLFVREDWHVAFDAGLCLVRHRVLARPFTLALPALELAITLLTTLVRSELLVGTVESLKEELLRV